MLLRSPFVTDLSSQPYCREASILCDHPSLESRCKPATGRVPEIHQRSCFVTAHSRADYWQEAVYLLPAVRKSTSQEELRSKRSNTNLVTSCETATGMATWVLSFV